MTIKHALRACVLLAVLAVSGLFSAEAAAVNKVRFCGSLTYNFWDSVNQQDRLIGGTQKADKHWAVLQKDGVTVWGPAYMNANCTGFVNITAGTYQFFVTSSVQIITNNIVNVFSNNSEQWTWTSIAQTVPANPSGDTTLNVTLAGGPVFNVSLIASIMGQEEVSISGNNVYKVYASQNCPGSISCVTNNILYLGSTAQTGPDSSSKTVIGHEMAHYLQSKLWGFWSYNYSTNASQELCKCDCVSDPLDKAHCMQSREMLGAARNEGWGHYYAARLYNLSADPTAPIGYYKNFLQPGNPDTGNDNCPANPNLLFPPVVVDALTPYTWLENRCLVANSGVELDWLGFFYAMFTRGTPNQYNYFNFRSVFQQECGGTGLCNGNEVVSWSTLQSAANAVFGAGSGKANQLINTGNTYGVDH